MTDGEAQCSSEGAGGMDAAAQVEADARRYRWLRTQANDVACVFTRVMPERPGSLKTYAYLDDFKAEKWLDEAIDMAMALASSRRASSTADRTPDPCPPT